MDTKPKKCPCGAPVARWAECPAACKAELCKPCFLIYLDAGVIHQIVKVQS